jgi:hypothetical protein
MRRIFVGVAALLGFTVLGLGPTVALASQNQFPSILCSKLRGTTTRHITISRCSVAKGEKKGYRKLEGNASELTAGGTLTWKPDGATVIVSQPALFTPSQNPCKTGDTVQSVTGSVTGGTSAVTNVGDTYHAEICTSPKGKLSLAPGTKLGI